MAIKLRRTPIDLTGKTSELTFQEMNNNLKSFYYSSSFDTTTKELELNFLSGSTSHSIDLSSLVDTVDTGSFLYSGSYNSVSNELTLYSVDQDYIIDLTDLVDITNTGSFLYSGSYNSTNNELTLYSVDQDYIIDLTDLQDITDTGSFYYSSSVDLNTITFYQGDGTTESVTVNTGSSVDVPGNNREIIFNDKGDLGASGSFMVRDQGTLRQIEVNSTMLGGNNLAYLKASGSQFSSLILNDVALTHDVQGNHLRIPGSNTNFRNSFLIQATGTGDYGRFAFGSQLQDSDFLLVRLTQSDTRAENAFKVEVSGSSSTFGELAFSVDKDGKLFAPRLTNRSEPYVLGYEPNNGEITYLSTGSFGGGGGSTSPGGSNTQVQFNDGGSFGGDSGLTYDKTNDTLTITSTNTNPSLKFSTAFPPVPPTPGFIFAELQAHSQTYSKEIGSMQFQLDTTAGTYSTSNLPSRFVVQTTPDGTASPTTKLQVLASGKLKLDEYGAGTFTGTATKWLAVDGGGNVIEENAPTGSGSTDYVSNVTFSGTSLAFTGIGSAFNSSVNLGSLSGSLVNAPDDIVYVVDSNTNEVIIGNSTPLGSSTIDEINGRTILITQDNSNKNTLRFGFASWTQTYSSHGANAKQTFECTGYNVGQDDFNIGVYLPQGSWDLYAVGHASGGGSIVSKFETNISIGASGATRYYPYEINEGAMFKVYYNYFHKKVVIWCSSWDGLPGIAPFKGAITFPAADPN